MEENGNLQDFSKLYPFLSKKGRGKRRRKTKPTLSTGSIRDKSDTDHQNPSESAADASGTYDNLSGLDELDDTEDDIDGVNMDHTYSSGVSRDAMVYRLPEFTHNSLEYEETITPERVNQVDDEAVESNNITNKDRASVQDEPVANENATVIEPTPIYNTRALSKYASTYQLEKFQKNALIIFNQEKIDGFVQPRLGTEKDVRALTNTFESFGFEVEAHNDLTKDDLFNELKKFSEKDFTDYGCIAVAVLTHGSKNGLLRAKDQQYSEIEVINLFRDYTKPTLVTKPKLLIIQACRGLKIPQAVPVLQAQGKVHKDQEKEELEPYILPVEADWLILHSSYAGSPSHRNDRYGSWFIQALCSKIDDRAPSEDFESIITEVKRDVAINKYHLEYNKKTLVMDINKQMPVVTSTLIRKLYLKRFGDEGVKESYVDRTRQNQDANSRHVALDSGNTTMNSPTTPLLVQFGPCSCFLDHFTYLRDCLRYFVEENPTDETALYFLDVANTFEETVEFNTSKDKMCKAISNHLLKNAQSSQYYKYLYFYKNPQSHGPNFNKY